MDKELKELGLNETEIKIYKTLINIKEGTASQIATNAGKTREGTYYTLKNLAKKGFVTEIKKGDIFNYYPSDLKILKEKISNKYEEEINSLDKIIKEYENLIKKYDKIPTVEIYQDWNNLKFAIKKLTENKNSTLYGIISKEIVFLDNNFSIQFRRLRRENNIYLKGLTGDYPELKKFKNKDEIDKRELKFLKELNELKSSIYIQENNVLIIKSNENNLIGIYINDKIITNMFKTIFNLIWNLV